MASTLIRNITYCQLRASRQKTKPFLQIFIRSPTRWTISTSQSFTNHKESKEGIEPETTTDGENEQGNYNVLYPGHIQTTTFQKSLLAFGSAIGCIVNPARDDMICSLGETTGPPALRYMHRKMQEDETGRQILLEKPLINTKTVDIEYLGSLPEETFGKAYWHFLDKNGFSPDARRPVQFVDDPDLMYVMLRYRQSHDLVHTLMGMPPNMLGEVAVKWFEAVQTRLPMCISAAMLGPLRLGPKHRQKYLNTYLPWAIRSGLKSKLLMNVYYEKHWETDLDKLRRELNLEPAPVPLVKTGKHTLS